MSEKKSNIEDTLRPEYDLDKLEIIARGPGWDRRRLLRKKGRARGLNPKRLVVTPNPALARTAVRKG